MRLAIEIALLAVCLFLMMDGVAKMMLFFWVIRDYWLIIGGGVAFLAIVFGLDTFLESQGFIVYHWWES